jgi:acetyl-CoA C-acetyltransferase
MAGLKDVVIVSAARTPIGEFGGVFRRMKANELGVVAAKEAMKRASISPNDIDDVIFGNCFMMTDEINVARVISLKAGIPFDVPAFTVQRQCASSLQALVCGLQQIQTGEMEVVLVGGVESMSTAPFVLKSARWGQQLRHGEMTDTVWEGLTDPVTGMIMGLTAENLAEEFNIGREEQDQLAYTSQMRAVSAIREGRFSEEIVAVSVPRGKKELALVDTDEHPRADITLEKLSALPPVFKKDGTVTAGNSSGINDGACAAVIMSKEKAAHLGLEPMARIVAHAVAAVEPERMGFGPVPATRKVLATSGWRLEDIELVELNEAFAAQYLSCEKVLGLNREITNVNGSGISLGHPVGCTALRILITLVFEMRRRDLHRGLATLCVGGGMGKAVLVER